MKAVQRATPHFEPLDTSHVLWACARLRLDVPPKAIKALLHDSRPKMKRFGTQVGLQGPPIRARSAALPCGRPLCWPAPKTFWHGCPALPRRSDVWPRGVPLSVHWRPSTRTHAQSTMHRRAALQVKSARMMHVLYHAALRCSCSACLRAHPTTLSLDC